MNYLNLLLLSGLLLYSPLGLADKNQDLLLYNSENINTDHGMTFAQLRDFVRNIDRPTDWDIRDGFDAKIVSDWPKVFDDKVKKLTAMNLRFTYTHGKDEKKTWYTGPQAAEMVLRSLKEKDFKTYNTFINPTAKNEFKVLTATPKNLEDTWSSYRSFIDRYPLSVYGARAAIIAGTRFLDVGKPELAQHFLREGIEKLEYLKKLNLLDGEDGVTAKSLVLAKLKLVYATQIALAKKVPEEADPSKWKEKVREFITKDPGYIELVNSFKKTIKDDFKDSFPFRPANMENEKKFSADEMVALIQKSIGPSSKITNPEVPGPEFLRMALEQYYSLDPATSAFGEENLQLYGKDEILKAAEKLDDSRQKFLKLALANLALPDFTLRKLKPQCLAIDTKSLDSEVGIEPFKCHKGEMNVLTDKKILRANFARNKLIEVYKSKHEKKNLLTANKSLDTLVFVDEVGDAYVEDLANKKSLVKVEMPKELVGKFTLIADMTKAIPLLNGKGIVTHAKAYEKRDGAKKDDTGAIEVVRSREVIQVLPVKKTMVIDFDSEKKKSNIPGYEDYTSEKVTFSDDGTTFVMYLKPIVTTTMAVNPEKRELNYTATGDTPLTPKVVFGKTADGLTKLKKLDSQIAAGDKEPVSFTFSPKDDSLYINELTSTERVSLSSGKVIQSYDSGGIYKDIKEENGVMKYFPWIFGNQDLSFLDEDLIVVNNIYSEGMIVPNNASPLITNTYQFFNKDKHDPVSKKTFKDFHNFQPCGEHMYFEESQMSVVSDKDGKGTEMLNTRSKLCRVEKKAFMDWAGLSSRGPKDNPKIEKAKSE